MYIIGPFSVKISSYLVNDSYVYNRILLSQKILFLLNDSRTSF